MDFLHQGLVYLLYTVYLLLVIVGFLTKVDMPQIAAVNLATTFAASSVPSVTLSPMLANPRKDAAWSEETYPELGRTRLEYAFRKADPSTGLVRHTFKVTVPTLKSVVTDPAGPYQPPPSVDFVSVAELNLFVHPRATAAEREKIMASILNSIRVDATFSTAISDTVAGKTIY